MNKFKLFRHFRRVFDLIKHQLTGSNFHESCTIIFSHGLPLNILWFLLNFKASKLLLISLKLSSEQVRQQIRTQVSLCSHLSSTCCSFVILPPFTTIINITKTLKININFTVFTIFFWLEFECEREEDSKWNKNLNFEKTLVLDSGSRFSVCVASHKTR